MKDEDDKGLDTRDRLLQAAGEIFARCGFKGATVREISQCAGANIAAVNYHFGDKERLYTAVLEHTLSSVMKKYPPDLGVTPASTAEERLRAFIRSFLFRMLDEGRPAWHGILMAREIADPTAALDHLIEKVIRPLYDHLAMIVKELLGGAKEGKNGDEADRENEERIRLCSFSIMGQCLFYRHARHAISKIHPEKFEKGDIERLSEHIMRFSMAAIRELAEEPGIKNRD